MSELTSEKRASEGMCVNRVAALPNVHQTYVCLSTKFSSLNL